MDGVAVRPSEQSHCAGVVTICRREGWSTYADDPELTHRVLTAPGVTARVAVAGDQVVGFIQVQGDGVVQAHVSNLAVLVEHRRRGIARALLRDAVAASGCRRADLLSDGPQSDVFTEACRTERGPGFESIRPALLRPYESDSGLTLVRTLEAEAGPDRPQATQLDRLGRARRPDQPAGAVPHGGGQPSRVVRR